MTQYMQGIWDPGGISVKRQLLVLAGLVALVMLVLCGFCGFSFCYWFFAPLVDPALTVQIKEGMNQTEVQAIIGAPIYRRRTENGERWTYYIPGGPVYIEFDKRGIVYNRWVQ